MSKYDHANLEQLMAQIRQELESGQADIDGSSPKATASRLSTSEIMRRVRAEVAKRRASSGESTSANGIAEEAKKFPHWQTAIPKLPSKREYILGELLAFSDLDFVSTIYQVVLRRNPSQGELAHYLTSLRDGVISKIEIVGEIRWSREGLARGVHVDGLLIPYTLRKWERRRFVGPVLRWLHAFSKLGQWERRYAVEAARQAREIQVLGETLNRVSNALDEWCNSFESRLATYPSLEEVKRRIDAGVREVVAQQASLSTALGGMRSRLDDIEQIENRQEGFYAQIEQMAAESSRTHEQALQKLEQVEAKYEAAKEVLNQRSYALLETQQRVEHVDRILTKISVPQPLEAIDKELKSLASRLIETKLDIEQRFATLNGLPAKVDQIPKSVDLDPFYVAFEDHFRGGRDLVRQRAEPYIELMRGAGAGTREAPVLDIGCGRGEWLELLREHGLMGRGIDLNRVFIEICRGHGLDVMEGDAISVLSAMPDNSIGAITSMHLVEHLSFEQLVILLDEARRVLVPGGLLLLETPNPENLSVGAHTFYLDPTHKNPIPPTTLQWMVQARGFLDAVVHRLTVARELNAPSLLAEDIQGASSINPILAQFNAAPDYAVVAKKI